MSYSKSQKKLAARLIKIGKKEGASRKQILSALATGIVESNLQNLSGGDADSAGWRQERAMYYKNPTNVKASAKRYYNETAGVLKSNPNISMGDLSQAVQRSAYPDRYAAVKGQAKGLLSDLGGKGGRRAQGGSDGGGAKARKLMDAGTGQATAYAAGPSKQDMQSTLLNFIRTEDKSFTDYLAVYEQEQAAKQAKLAKKEALASASASTKQPKSATFAGVKAGGKKEPRQKSTIKLPKSNKKAIVEIGKMAQKMGLSVGENPHFGGVAPVHASGSYHYSDRAIDVSGDPKKMAKFANMIGKRYGPKLAELFWNGRHEENWDNGNKVGQGFVSGHTDHVHVAI